ncbi:hypothetical protein AAZX31_06G269700 [Glycine max]|uniref:Protein FAM136A n=1 Tax=Glycine soja TaxID=3848 RepID=A0A445KFG9_GLYSO|nr:uncharacterized protein LOC114414243 [Glycine soja]XP_028234345.1 uncharacterized protein LOC114414244 [Glycine soja]KAH1128041.1 hypothetical protein GYH30_016559 [Glycine max]RZC09601.1 hypothetical protein D0Y65_016093 [Glycine soja]RZC09604.1 hypothetical protein D0Y65_016096 [Glycine soja]
MDNTEAEEQLASEMLLNQKLEELDEAYQTKISHVYDYANFTLPKDFFKCGYECFDGSKRQEEVINCVNNCADRLTKVQKALNNEINMFEQKMGKSVLVCQLKHDEAKLQQKAGAGPDLVSCLDQAIQENIKFLPDINKLKAAFGISDDSS